MFMLSQFFLPPPFSLNCLPSTTCKTMQSKIRSNISGKLFWGQFIVVLSQWEKNLENQESSLLFLVCLLWTLSMHFFLFFSFFVSFFWYLGILSLYFLSLPQNCVCFCQLHVHLKTSSVSSCSSANTNKNNLKLIFHLTFRKIPLFFTMCTDITLCRHSALP